MGIWGIEPEEAGLGEERYYAIVYNTIKSIFLNDLFSQVNFSSSVLIPGGCQLSPGGWQPYSRGSSRKVLMDIKKALCVHMLRYYVIVPHFPIEVADCY